MDKGVKDKFCRYEAFRQIGIANMLDIATVTAYTHLREDEIFIIVHHYDSFTRLYYDEELINHYKESIDDKTSRIQDIYLETI